MNKRKLYESIMKNVAKQVKKALNEGEIEDGGDAFTTIVDPRIEDIKKRVLTTQDWKAEDINNELFDILVPSDGNADTVAGEILRAVNRIVYRRWNDGDVAGEGYGRETVNPAVRYLWHNVKYSSEFKRLINELYNHMEYNELSEDEYDELLEKLVKEEVLYIIDSDVSTKPNSEDMWDYKDDEKDVDRYDEEEDYTEDDWENA